MNQADEPISYKVEWIQQPEHPPIVVNVIRPYEDEPTSQVVRVVKAP